VGRRPAAVPVVLILVCWAALGGFDLPPSLQVLAHPLVIASAPCWRWRNSSATRFPGSTAVSDSIHTFIRIPPARRWRRRFSATAAPPSRPRRPCWRHLRRRQPCRQVRHPALINTRRTGQQRRRSFGEEALLGGGLWLAFAHPLAFLAALAVFMLATLWMLRRLWRWLRQARPPLPRPERPL